MIVMVHAIPAPIMSRFAFSPALPNRPGGLEAPALSQRLHDCLATIADPSRTDSLASVVRYFNDCNSIGDCRWQRLGRYGSVWTEQRSLSTFLALPNGIPSADTFRRVLAIDAKQFAQCFEQWIKQLVEDLGIGVIAIDGKTVKGSYERRLRSQHCIWSVLGQPNSVWC